MYICDMWPHIYIYNMYVYVVHIYVCEEVCHVCHVCVPHTHVITLDLRFSSVSLICFCVFVQFFEQ